LKMRRDRSRKAESFDNTRVCVTLVMVEGT
jgi:hypothetical protein